jgi:hypothetical protein
MTIRATGGKDTPWGTEIIWVSNEKFCGKILIFKEAGAKTPIQFQKVKHKTWFVNEGTFIVRWIDTATGVAKENVIKQADVVDVPPLRPFQLEALLPNSILLESGTAELENDLCILTPDGTTDLQQQEL